MLKFYMFVRSKKFAISFFLILFLPATILPQELPQKLPQELDQESTQDSVPNSSYNSTNNTNSPNTSFYQDPTEIKRDNDPYTSLLLRVIGILVIFSIVAFVVFKIIGNKQKLEMQVGPFKLIYDFPLSINKSLKVIQIVNEFFLLGVSQDNIQLICKLEDKETIDALKLEKDKVLPKGSFFQDVFSKYLNVSKIDPLDMTKKLKSRLKKME